MGKVDGVADRKVLRRIQPDELLALAHLHRFEHAQILAQPLLPPQSHALHHLHKRQRAAIENRQLEIVQLHDGVVHAHADKGRKHVLGGGDQHAFFHQAGGVTHLGDIAPGGLHLEVIEIGAAEDNARTRRGGHDAHVHRDPAVKTDAGTLHRRPDCLFKSQERPRNPRLSFRLQRFEKNKLWDFRHSAWFPENGLYGFGIHDRQRSWQETTVRLHPANVGRTASVALF